MFAQVTSQGRSRAKLTRDAFYPVTVINAREENKMKYKINKDEVCRECNKSVDESNAILFPSSRDFKKPYLCDECYEKWDKIMDELFDDYFSNEDRHD